MKEDEYIKIGKNKQNKSLLQKFILSSSILDKCKYYKTKIKSQEHRTQNTEVKVVQFSCHFISVGIGSCFIAFILLIKTS